ncbi:hypothetical protein [Neobacillus sp. Marseille-QA0830]
MKSGIAICSVLLAMAVMAGCAHVSSAKKEVTNHEDKAVNDPKSTKKETAENTNANGQEVQLDHLKLTVSSKWKVEKGLDSAAFSIDGKPVGLIESLAYSDSLEALLPNQSIVSNKQKLEQLPFEAYQVTTSSDAVQSASKKETHIYIFVEPKKEVYDMHFDANAVNQETILEMVKSLSIF